MQYDNYELRIKKVERFFKFVFKNLPKIIVCASIVMTTVVTLLATRGIVTANDEGYDGEIFYGETLEYEAKAFLSEIEYEYSPVGQEEWTKEHPRDVGVYDIRPMAKATFGYRYGDVKTFTIKPTEVEINIASDTVIYGDKPQLSADLMYNDVIHLSDVEFNSDRTEVSVVSALIVDEEGRDVTANYVLSFSTAPIETLPRPITVDVLDSTKIYDGAPLVSNEYKISNGNLVYDDVIEATFDSSITDAGYIRNSADYMIRNASGEDVSRYYKITEEIGYLTVLKREISILTADLSGVVYDAEQREKAEYTITSEMGLVDGHTISVDEWTKIVNAGSLENKMHGVKILDADGRDVTSSYDISFEWGSLTVDKRPIEIVTESESKIYDGMALSNTDITLSEGGSLVSGHKTAVLTYANKINAGTYENTVTVMIADEDGKDVSSNYAISYNYGTLTIDKKDLTVTTPDGEWTYNGFENSMSAITVEGLAYTDSWKISQYASIKDVGSLKNTVSISITRNGVAADENYNVTYNEGTLTVNKRPISITTNSGSYEYDGESHSNKNFETEDLVAGETFEVISSAFVTYVTEGIVENKFTDYRIVDQSGNDVTHNYEIPQFNCGTLEVTKRTIRFKTASGNKMYDGKPLAAPEWSVSRGYSLADGDELNAPELLVELTDAGTVINDYVGDIVILRNGVDVTENYDILTTEKGRLTVTRRPIHVVSESFDIVYDGKAHSNDILRTDTTDSRYYPLCDGHTFEAVGDVPSFKNVSDTGKQNIFEYRIVCNGEEINKNNYIIEETWGTVKIDPRPVTISSSVIELVYDGKEHSDSTLHWDPFNAKTNTGMCEGHVAVIKTAVNAPVFKNVITGGVNQFDFEIHCGEEIIPIENYDITYNPGTVTIKPRPITISTQGLNKVYDGKVFNNHEIEYTPYGKDEGICEDHVINVMGGSSFINVTEKSLNEVHYVIKCGDEIISKRNYTITEEWGEVTITPRPITIRTQGYNDVYNGKIFNNHEIEYTPYGKDIGLCEGHTIDVRSGYSFINVTRKTEKNIVRYVIKCGDETISKDNYAITEEWGEVTITPRPITVITNGYEGIYDGQDHSDFTFIYTEYDEQGKKGLCSGQRIDLIYGTQTTIKNVFEGENALEVVIYESSTSPVEVTKNYNIEYKYGKVHVKPRPIYIETDSYNDIYDGQDHTTEYNTPKDVSNGVDEGLCAGHNFFITSSTQILNVVDNADNIVGFRIISDTEDVTKNYDFKDKISYGKITVSKRTLYVETDTYNEVYDGIDHTWENSVPKDVSVGENAGLCDGHYFVTTKNTQILNVVNNVENKVEFYIACDGNEIDINNYDLHVDFGRITVSKRSLYVETDTYNEVYDGIDHTWENSVPKDVSVGENAGLCDGHYFVTTKNTQILNVVNNVENKVEFYIACDGNEIDINNYDLHTDFGIVNIAKRVVKISTGSQTWQYDGKPHTNTKFTLLEGTSIAPNQTANADMTTATYITEEGKVENVFKLIIVDGNMIDCTYNYDVQIGSKGTLEIIPKDTSGDGEEPGGSGEGGSGEGGSGEGGSGGNGSGGKLDLSGNIALPDTQGGEGEGESSPSIIITTDTSGHIYLKRYSFGDYTGTGWNQAVEYDKLILNYASAQYLTAFALEYYGQPTSYIKVKSLNGEYLLPYYSKAQGSDVQLSDVDIMGDAEDEYYLYYFSWNYSDGTVSIPDSLKDFEAEYYAFVRENYLAIDSETESYMQTIIDKQGFSADDPDIIKKVAEYIQGAAIYNLEYDRALNNSTNKVVDFLSKYKEGVCQHYASAATMLFRALGIPARYTVGYAAYAEAGVETTISEGHAWVEVYLEGFGWVTVEVTGGGPGGSGSGGGGFGGGGSGSGEGEGGGSGSGEGEGEGGSDETKPPEKQKLTLKPVYTVAEYTGETIQPKDELEPDFVLYELLKKNYTYTVDVVGSMLRVGTGSTYIDPESFVLYDPDGNVVTDMFEITFEDGIIEVVPKVLKIYIYQKNMEYTSEAFTYNSDEFLLTPNNPDGIEIVMSKINISMTNVGAPITSSMINADINSYLEYRIYQNGVDVTSEYRLIVADYYSGEDYDVLTVNPRRFEITTDSATKQYDGKPLTCHSFFISRGYIAEGHTVVINNFIGSQTLKDGESPNNFVTGGDSYRRGSEETWQVFDSEGNDVTYNYELNNYTFGTLKVI